MALIIEDGTGVAGANSYVSAADYRAYRQLRGLPNSTSLESDEAHLVAAFMWIAAPFRMVVGADGVERSQPLEYKGVKTFPAYLSAFPRTGAIIDELTQAPNAITYHVVYAQMAKAAEFQEAAGQSSQPQVIQTNQAIKRTKMGPLEVEYFGDTVINNESSRAKTPALTADAEVLLAPWIKTPPVMLVSSNGNARPSQFGSLRIRKSL